MFSKNINKVKFQDQQLDDYVLENSVLQSKLQSKIEALSIMNNELDKCRMERDRYRVLVEQLKIQNTVPRNHESNINIYKQSHYNTISGGELLAKTREQNNMLKLEVETLRTKTEEAFGDIQALRKQLQLSESNSSMKNTLSLYDSNKDYEELVQQLEKVQKMYQQTQQDYRASLDEKEELVADRDYYKDKVSRLNHQISYILNSRAKLSQIDDSHNPPKPVLDMDAIVTENKYLQDRIAQLQVEKEITKRALMKYKSLLENRHKNNSENLKKGFIDVMTQKQVRDFLETNTKNGLKSSAAELKSLCLGLFEALNDKSIALQHQRKTNQILANRIVELEKTLESWCNGEKYIPAFPSQLLVDEYLPDSDANKLASEESKDKLTYNFEEEAKDIDSYENISPSKDREDNVDSLNEFTTVSKHKIVLPVELEELVKEALAELKPIN